MPCHRRCWVQAVCAVRARITSPTLFSSSPHFACVGVGDRRWTPGKREHQSGERSGRLATESGIRASSTRRERSETRCSWQVSRKCSTPVCASVLRLGLGLEPGRGLGQGERSPRVRRALTFVLRLTLRPHYQPALTLILNIQANMSKGHNDFLTAWVQHEKKIVSHFCLPCHRLYT